MGSPLCIIAQGAVALTWTVTGALSKSVWKVWRLRLALWRKANNCHLSFGVVVLLTSDLMILKHHQDFPSFLTSFNSSITCYTNQGFPNFYKVCRIYSHFIYRDFSSVTCVYWGFIVSHQKEKKYKNKDYRGVALWPLLLSVSLTAAFPTNTFILLSEKKKKNDQNIKVISVQISTVIQIRKIHLHIWNVVTFYKP